MKKVPSARAVTLRQCREFQFSRVATGKQIDGTSVGCLRRGLNVRYFVHLEIKFAPKLMYKHEN